MHAALTLGHVLCMKQILLVLHLFCMPLFSMTTAGMNIQKKIVSVLFHPINAIAHVHSREESCLLNTTQNCIGNGGKIVSHIWQSNEHDLTKIQLIQVMPQ